MTVYIVTVGEYSDYRIVGVYTDEQLANTLAAYMNAHRGEACVERWEADANADHLRANRTLYFLRITKEGEVSDVEASGSSIAGMADTGDPGFDIHGRMYDFVWADSPEHAKKIMNERLVAYLASGRPWGNKQLHGAHR